MTFATALQKRAETYLQNLHKHQDAFGFIEVDACDSTLFSGLLGCHPKVDVNLLAARDIETKQWFRRPLEYHECYSMGKSRSTISRDMLLGVMAWAYFNNRPDVLVDMWRYANRHFWKMGQGRGVFMSPDYMALLAKLIYKMTGRSYFIRHWPLTSDPYASGFRSHLQCVYLLLAWRAEGELSDRHRETLRRMFFADPHNLLKRVLFFKLTRKIRNVMFFDWRYYPKDRNPSNKERSEPWAIQRSERDIGLKPYPDTRWHSGGDLLFCQFVFNLKI